MIVRLLVVAAMLASASGCATVLRGTEQDFSIQSTPPGATATLSTGQVCITPCELRLRRKDDFDVTFTMDGYQTGTAHVTSGWSRGGTQTFVIGNIILGGLIGMGVDASNGATRDLYPNPLVVTLVPVEPVAPVAPATPEPPADPRGGS
ncbi:MAG: PEGA domain-containing protein [Hyphomonadaceae bacterium]|nr:PEGA domain-containing protein [Hyphomonadaceae bacterium]